MLLRILALAGCMIAAVPAVAAPKDGPVVQKFAHLIPNIPGKSLIALEVNFAPGQVSMPHRHAKSSFIYAYVLSGTIRSQVEGEPARDYHAGDSWYEAPGAHHIQGENMSKTRPAKLLAVFVVDTGDMELTKVDDSMTHTMSDHAAGK